MRRYMVGELERYLAGQPLRIALALLAIGIIAPGAGAASDEQIRNAMNRAKDYLYSVQQPSGLWEYPGLPHQSEGGLTAIATYALLADGESSSSARLAKAIQYLMHLKSDNVYVLGVRPRYGRSLARTGSCAASKLRTPLTSQA